MKATPDIRPHLFWEYRWEEIDFARLATVVIERVVERGNPEEWGEILRFYGKEEILKVVEKSTRLDPKHKNFARLYLNSPLIYDLPRRSSNPS